MAVRFEPACCPGCGEPLRPKYSTYRHGTRSWLFPAGLVGGAIGVLVLLALSFWAAFELNAAAFAGAGLQRRESGMLTFLLQAPMVVLIGFGARAGWRALHRLPRTFGAGCGTCSWTGPCRVFEDPGGSTIIERYDPS
jgi:hypothetical protein